MTHEEKAREIAVACYDMSGLKIDVNFLIIRLTHELASAEKKGREEERKEWESGNRTMKMVWNEAISAARKVAEEHKSTEGECPESIANAEGYRTAVSQIAESINKLKRG